MSEYILLSNNKENMFLVPFLFKFSVHQPEKMPDAWLLLNLVQVSLVTNTALLRNY